MRGKLQGQQILQQRQEEDFARQLQVLGLQQKEDEARRAAATAGHETLLKYAVPRMTPEAAAQTAVDISGRERTSALAPRPALSGLRVPTGPGWEGTRGMLQQFQAPPPAQIQPPVQAPPSATADPIQQARLRTMSGIARLLPGGRDILSAVTAPPPMQQAQAATTLIPTQPLPIGAPPTETPEPSPTIRVPWLDKAYEIETISPKVKAAQADAYKAVLKSLRSAQPHVVATAQGWLRNWVGNPRTQADYQANDTILRQLEPLGLGTDPALQKLDLAREQATLKALGDAPEQLRGTPLTPQTIPTVIARLDNLLAQEDEVNKGRSAAQRAPGSVVWGANRAKIASAQQALAQGDTAGAIKIAGEVMDSVASPQLDPKDQVAAYSKFLDSLKTWTPAQLSDRKFIEAQANAMHVGNQARNLLNQGFNFAMGPAEKRVLGGLKDAKSLAQFGPEGVQLLLDRIIPISRLTDTPIPLNAKLVLQMTPAQRDAAARGWENVRLSGERKEIARGQLAIAYSVLQRVWQEANLKVQRAATKQENPSVAYQAVKNAAAEANRAFDKTEEAYSYTGMFKPNKPNPNAVDKILQPLWNAKEKRRAAVERFAKERLRLDVQTGQQIAPSVTMTPGQPPGFSFQLGGGLQGGPPPPQNIPGLRGTGQAPVAPGDPRTRLQKIEARLRELKARRRR